MMICHFADIDEGTITWRKAKIKLTAHGEAEPRLSNGLIEAFLSTMTMVFLGKQMLFFSHFFHQRVGYSCSSLSSWFLTEALLMTAGR